MIAAQQVAVAELGTSALTALNQRMRAYTAASAATTASSATENGESTPVSAWTWSSLASRAAVGAASHEQDPLPAGVPHIGPYGLCLSFGISMYSKGGKQQLPAINLHILGCHPLLLCPPPANVPILALQTAGALGIRLQSLLSVIDLHRRTCHKEPVQKGSGCSAASAAATAAAAPGLGLVHKQQVDCSRCYTV